MKIILVANGLGHCMGSHLMEAALALGWEVKMFDLRDAWSSSRWWNRFNYYLLNKLPQYLKKFSNRIVADCKTDPPDFLLSTGVAPVSADALRQLRALAVPTVNLLTDDPWNPRNGARFFWESLREYDLIANPRRANIPDLISHGCRRVEYLPFAYNPKVHFIEKDASAGEVQHYECDVAIIGAADDERLPIAHRLADEGFDLVLYGGFWDRDKRLAKYARGEVYGRELRLAVQLARCQVGMVRRANRDGHAMRSLEFPAMGACMLAEDTQEHRELYGDALDSSLYWSDLEGIIKAVRGCNNNATVNELSRKALTHRISGGGHIYEDRLLSIRQLVK